MPSRGVYTERDFALFDQRMQKVVRRPFDGGFHDCDMECGGQTRGWTRLTSGSGTSPPSRHPERIARRVRRRPNLAKEISHHRDFPRQEDHNHHHRARRSMMTITLAASRALAAALLNKLRFTDFLLMAMATRPRNWVHHEKTVAPSCEYVSEKCMIGSINNCELSHSKFTSAPMATSMGMRRSPAFRAQP
jgi:hypothetical protein